MDTGLLISFLALVAAAGSWFTAMAAFRAEKMLSLPVLAILGSRKVWIKNYGSGVAKNMSLYIYATDTTQTISGVVGAGDDNQPRVI